MKINKMIDLNLSNKRVLIRVDFNVPIEDNKITSTIRIEASIDTIKYALNNNAKVMIFSHLGRPTEGIYDKNFSLLPIVNFLEKKLDVKVRLEKNYLNDKIEFKKDELIILENVRFNKGENSNNVNLSKKYAELCDIFVMDAFATSHRRNSSTYGVIKYSKISCAGLLFCKELNSLNKIFNNPCKPIVAIIGGSKISTKLSILKSLSKIVNNLIVGGGIANTFINALGYNIGKSLFEKSQLENAKNILKICNIPIPIDVVVSKEFNKNSKTELKPIDKINNDEYIIDLGEKTIFNLLKIINSSNTIIWNGPVGVFEFPNARFGTKSIANCIAKSNAFSIAGGGDTIAAIDLFNIYNDISYISTGGGAFLKFIEGNKLPAIKALEEKFL